jgi:hypothetical protein
MAGPMGHAVQHLCDLQDMPVHTRQVNGLNSHFLVITHHIYDAGTVYVAMQVMLGPSCTMHNYCCSAAAVPDLSFSRLARSMACRLSMLIVHGVK